MTNSVYLTTTNQLQLSKKIITADRES